MMDRVFTVANAITLARLCLIPLLWIRSSDWFDAMFIALLIVVSDVEGSIARVMNQESRLGAQLDKFVDVLFVASATWLFALSSTGHVVALACLFASRLLKWLLRRYQSQYWTSSFFLKGSYALFYATLLWDIVETAPVEVYILLAGVFWLEALRSVFLGTATSALSA